MSFIFRCWWFPELLSGENDPLSPPLFKALAVVHTYCSQRCIMLLRSHMAISRPVQRDTDLRESLLERIEGSKRAAELALGLLTDGLVRGWSSPGDLWEVFALVVDNDLLDNLMTVDINWSMDCVNLLTSQCDEEREGGRERDLSIQISNQEVHTFH